MATGPPISLPTGPTSSPSTSSTPTPPPPTSTEPPPSPTPPSSSSSTEPPSSSSSSSSTSSSTSLPATTTTPVVPTTTTTQLPTTSTTGPAILTQTSTRFISSTGDTQPTNNADTGSSSKGFFSNTGAVAGVFSVVGLVGLALVIALITNGIRRRRARKFDKELAAATLEAASAPKPVFLDDDDDDPYRNGSGAGRMGYNNAGGYGAGGGFSDASSHGTFTQPPMSVNSHGGEAYGMREMGGVGPGEIYEPYGGGAAAAGAAGIGVARARSMRSDGGYAAGLQDGAAPYAAFAVPTQQHDPYASQPRGMGRDTNTDILEAAGMGAHIAGAGMLSRGQSQYKNAYNSQYQPYPAQPQYGGLHQRSPSQLQQAQELEYANLNRGQSMGSREGHGGALPLSAASHASSNATQYYSPVAESYQSHPYTQGGQQNPTYPVVEEDMDDAYGGYVADEHQGGVAGGATPVAASPVSATRRQSGLPNPFEGVSSTGHGKQEYDDRDSRYSDEEEEAPKRVLKVANE
ncbi:hypothetical protein M413DRAFT_22017 [Hebeloma cylindrosporum]|uniref:REJ domain-containing protein n=1 Tax=Hebeloma cylindrosporum TaxID=76867 RepID=A0A0C2Z9T6_HEBCY|nr:hypothetical protein M413DRAFT_22017 [Hebeloma cylindrosporum h7]